MKTIILFRHAKSDWSAGYPNDHDRPLAGRGRKAAKAMGEFLALAGPVPETAVSSSALRAARTLKLARKAGKWKCAVRLTDALYNCSPAEILDQVRAEPDGTQTLLLVSHEPTCSETISLFTGLTQVRFPTAAMARLDLPVNHWHEASFGHGQLVWLIFPELVIPLL